MVRILDHDFPENRYYDVDNQVWYAPLPDGTIRAGFTPLSMTLAGDALVFTPKRLGKPFEPNRWFAMVECGKWIGSARAAFHGVVLSYNERLVADPSLLNRDAFGEGWMVIVKADAEGWRDTLSTGDRIKPDFEAWLASEAFRDRED